jgi:DNA-binding CsgD family transcriptional regulator
VDAKRSNRARDQLREVAGGAGDWLAFSHAASDALEPVVPFDRCCWHSVDPGTVLFTGSLLRDVGCSGTWLAEHEYVNEDVNKWSFLAHSGKLAGATSLATHGELSRSARHRSQAGLGIGDELRVSFVVGGTYWGAAAFLRDRDRPWFTEEEVRFVAALSGVLAEGMRAGLVTRGAPLDAQVLPADEAPGVVVFDEHGRAEMVSPAAEHWIAQLVEEPAPTTPADSKLIQAVAARARVLGRDADPVELAARSRARTRNGSWLVIYGTPLTGGPAPRTAVVIQPAASHEVAPLVALAYGLTERERQIVRLCMEGRPTKEIAAALHVSPYTVQDHLKSVFDKTGVRTRNELVGQIFLEHYAPRWEEVSGAPIGWDVRAATEDPSG